VHAHVGCVWTANSPPALPRCGVPGCELGCDGGAAGGVLAALLEDLRPVQLPPPALRKAAQDGTAGLADLPTALLEVPPPPPLVFRQL
jgi:hypothetical protein